MSDDTRRLTVRLNRFPLLPEWLSWIPGYYIKVDLVIKRIDSHSVNVQIGSYANQLITVENHSVPKQSKPIDIPYAIKG